MSKQLAAPAYTITALVPLPGGRTSYANAINPKGDVVGAAQATSGNMLAVLWRDGKVTDLGTLGGPNSRAADISPKGEIVGAADSGAGVPRAFVWRNGALSALAELQGGGHSEATSISGKGSVVGRVAPAAGPEYAVLWRDGRGAPVALTPPGVFSHATCINDDQAERMLVSASTNKKELQVWLWDNGRSYDLGVLPGFGNMSATKISSAGHVVGTAEHGGAQRGIGGHSRAFLWDKDRLVDLGTLPGFTASRALSVNSEGQVVGACDVIEHHPRTHAFLWTEGALYDLNDLLPRGSGWELCEGRDINDHGQIVGWGLTNGQRQAFVLSPK